MVGLVNTVAGTGTMVQRGYRLASARVQGAFPAVAVLGWSMGALTLAAGLTAILMCRVPAFLMNARMLPQLVARREWRYLLTVAGTYAVGLTTLGYVAAQLGGITAISGTVVALEIGIAVAFRQRLRRLDAGIGDWPR